MQKEGEACQRTPSDQDSFTSDSEITVIERFVTSTSPCHSNSNCNDQCDRLRERLEQALVEREKLELQNEQLLKQWEEALEYVTMDGEFVVIPHQLDVEIAEKHLEDASLYRPSSEKEFKSQYRKLNNEWVKMARAAGLKPSVIYHLKIDLPTCLVLYLLIKTHKLVSSDDLVSTDPSLFKVRPIISCVDRPTDRVTWLITLVLTQLLMYIPAHLTNTQMFLDRLRNAEPNNAYVMESFVVTAFYTNVSNDSAMQAIRELLIQHEGATNMYGFSIQQLTTLLKECLNCSIFTWSGSYYAQIRGLAMGQRLAPSLAIPYMS
uniref:Fungal_trans domain-containing protein n=1 Tax=Angiostrongylus cantonensis TaxID=6313 RepID=A0A0K0CXK6_ANGCA